MHVPVISTLLASLFDGHVPARAGFSILKLRPRQSLVVRYESVGSSHHVVYRFEFTDHQVIVSDLGVGRPGQKRELGACKLSDEDLLKLDHLFAHYANGPYDGCTTIDTIKLTLKHGQRPLRSATFVDASCHTDDREGMISLERIARRLLQPGINANVNVNTNGTLEHKR